ncbi:MAG: hypothetical protein E7275_05160 [Pseudobutyrivibrio sp.]|uniref:Uncharacterized protein n=1 Tax=Pseudobutyrivibrio ruminis TaxID=46206 RepID=A0A2G3EAT5_9FIRM|nr:MULTISPECIES: hypothetical protein [Pseudobutyrivibrio]MBE5903658.1 hypothetical protein [Pseudobutyrivibrio sp.]PHU40330.1 hypothetical protein CSX00_07090 [Pseudobutyrivibrio ruminis]
MKQKQYEEISEEITKLEVERDNLVEVKNEIAKATNKIVDEAVERIADTEMKKEFMRYALLDEPKTSIGKIVSMAFGNFKVWWELERKTRVVKETKESVLEKLKKYSNRQKSIENRRLPSKGYRIEIE